MADISLDSFVIIESKNEDVKKLSEGRKSKNIKCDQNGTSEIQIIDEIQDGGNIFEKKCTSHRDELNIKSVSTGYPDKLERISQSLVDSFFIIENSYEYCESVPVYNTFCPNVTKIFEHDVVGCRHGNWKLYEEEEEITETIIEVIEEETFVDDSEYNVL